jgi:hypothetical protein
LQHLQIFVYAHPRLNSPAHLQFSPAIEVARVPASSDSDTATAQTVRMMTDYIRKCVDDPQVQAAANYAWKHFASGRPEPDMKCWGVFWYVKHCIKFRLDEATMFRVGERDQQDFLTAPDVLLRMQSPAEDCDGFTMLEAALLQVLGIPVVIATVAADTADRSRWSHVFPCALLPGDRVLPLDASHGPAPGWMVPPERIFRWQAWNLLGEPVKVEPRQHRGLHGYVRGGRGRVRWARGMGDYCSDGTFVSDISDCGSGVSVINPTPPSTPISSPAPSSNDKFFQQLALGGEKIFGTVVAPPAYQQVTRDANGNIISSTTVAAGTGQPGSAIASALGGGITPTMLMVGGGILLVFLVFMGRK